MCCVPFRNITFKNLNFIFQAIQDIARAHVESFNYVIKEGLRFVTNVSLFPVLLCFMIKQILGMQFKVQDTRNFFLFLDILKLVFTFLLKIGQGGYMKRAPPV